MIALNITLVVMLQRTGICSFTNIAELLCYALTMSPLYITIRGAGTILYIGGPTNQNKLCGKSGGGTNT